ncbi:hypothetical protein OROMI_014100 [Orobanche minor]
MIYNKMAWEVKRRKGGTREPRRKEAAGWRLGTTFLVRNFPEDCKREELWDRFAEVGKVEDLYLPKKRDVRGFRFGFVRLSKGGSTEDMLRDLNRIWIGSFIIRAFLPKHERGGVRQGSQRRGIQPERIKSFEASCHSRRVEGVSYAERVTGKSGRQEVPKVDEKEESIRVVEFQSSEEDRRWLEGSFTGLLKDCFSWEEHGEELQCECAGSLTISPLGNNLLLLRKGKNRSVAETLKGYEEWSSFWLSWCRPWKGEDVNQTREIWTKWRGVPLHARSSNFFEKACLRVGALIEIPKVTRCKERLDVAFVKIRTGLDPIIKILDCKVDGVSFRVRIEDACRAELVCIRGRREVEETSSESDFSLNELNDFSDIDYVGIGVQYMPQLRKYVPYPSHIIDFGEVEIEKDVTFEERPVKILERRDKQLRHKTIPLVKVQWSKHGVEGATWELEDDMRSRYPELFDS